jgi:hypothetical protein
MGLSLVLTAEIELVAEPGAIWSFAFSAKWSQASEYQRWTPKASCLYDDGS